MFGAAVDLSKRILFQWIDPAKRHQAPLVEGRLRSGPVVLRFHPRILIRYGRTKWVSKLIRNGEHDAALDSGIIHLPDQIFSGQGESLWRCNRGTKQM